MKIMSSAEASKDFINILDSLNDDADMIFINSQNDKDAVVMSLDHYNSLVETIYLLRTPANAAHLTKSIAQYRAGNRIKN